MSSVVFAFYRIRSRPLDSMASGRRCCHRINTVRERAICFSVVFAFYRIRPHPLVSAALGRRSCHRIKIEWGREREQYVFPSSFAFYGFALDHLHRRHQVGDPAIEYIEWIRTERFLSSLLSTDSPSSTRIGGVRLGSYYRINRVSQNKMFSVVFAFYRLAGFEQSLYAVV